MNSKCEMTPNWENKVCYIFKEDRKFSWWIHYNESPYSLFEDNNILWNFKEWPNLARKQWENIENLMTRFIILSELIMLNKNIKGFSKTELSLLKDLYQTIEKHVIKIMKAIDIYYTDDSYIEFSLFIKEIELVEELLKKAMKFFKSLIFSSFLSALIDSIQNISLSDFDLLQISNQNIEDYISIYENIVKIEESEAKSRIDYIDF